MELKASEQLRKIWGFETYKPGQEEAIASVLEGRDTVVLFPTGGGKSLCYQLPATLLEGLTIVVSPLIALMQDQSDQLARLGIRAATLDSSLHPAEVEQRLLNARNGMYRLLYLTPERLASVLWQHYMHDLNISLVAVDEAHCISKWGHDFRPEYRSIRSSFEGYEGEFSWIALTATATPEVRKDLIENLRLDQPHVIVNGFSRESLVWWVVESNDKRRLTERAVRKGCREGSGILYVATRKGCEEWAERFRNAGIQAEHYHAGLESQARQQVQTAWMKGECQLVVATNAFGMGVDKPDCRFVIHHEMPTSVEAYYQEAGRAGRDGETSWSVALFSEADHERAISRIEWSWPDIMTLQKVYDALCDELGLAVGSEQEHAEPVSLQALARRSGKKASVVRNALRVLERLGLASVAVHREPRLGLRFLVSEQALGDWIDRATAERAERIDILFRQFGREVFHDIRYLRLGELEVKLRLSREEVLRFVRILEQEDRLIEVRYLEDEPMVRLREARSPRLPARPDEVEGYREVLVQKLEEVRQFVRDSGCREVWLRRYFGENSAESCGRCDYCLQERSGRGSFPGDPEEVLKQLIEARGEEQLKEILKWPSARVRTALRALYREDLIGWEEQEGVVCYHRL